jgi:cyclophilin family peptidyl-prolyl cis-trans isomerase
MKNFIVLGMAVGITAVGAWYFSGSNTNDSYAIDLEAARQTAAAFEGAQAVAPTEVATTPVPASTETVSEEKRVTKATLQTNKGDIMIEFFGSDAPNTVANFIKLAGAGFYNGTKFHRVIKGFMIQGGDPLSKDDSKPELWGRGGPGYAFADEIHANNRNMVGTIAMANSGPNTNGSQFFINVNDNNFLDTKHTVFGKVTAGASVVQAIENTATGQADRPLEAVVITGVTLQ